MSDKPVTPPGKQTVAAGHHLEGDRRGDPRMLITVPVLCRYDSVLDFVENQSMNISRTGMFIVTEAPPAMGARIDFRFELADGYVLLTGSAEVVRVVKTGALPGMGVRFLDLDAANRRLIDRIVTVNDDEGRVSKLNFDFARPATMPSMSVVAVPRTVTATPTVKLPPSAPASPTAAAREMTATATATAPLPAGAAPPPRAPGATSTRAAPPAAAAAPAPAPLASTPARPSASGPPFAFSGRSLHVVLGPATLDLFTANILINARSGGLFVPADEDVPLGTIFEVKIVDGAGETIAAGKGKVVAKQSLRIGIRLADVGKDVLVRLQTEVAKLSAAK